MSQSKENKREGIRKIYMGEKSERTKRDVKSLAKRLIVISMCTYPLKCTEMAHVALKSLVPVFLTD